MPPTLRPASTRVHESLFGATPGPDEFDNREIWNEDEALAGIEEAIHILAGAVAPDGTQLADERESLLWGFVNTLHAQVQRLDRGIDKIAPEMKDLGQEQDGSEIKSRELELLTDRVQNLGDRRDAFETMRDLAAEGYRAETGDVLARPQRSRWPIFDILPSRGLPPVVCCRGTRPSQAEKSRPRRKLSIGGAKA